MLDQFLAEYMRAESERQRLRDAEKEAINRAKSIASMHNRVVEYYKKRLQALMECYTQCRCIVDLPEAMQEKETKRWKELLGEAYKDYSDAISSKQ